MSYSNMVEILTKQLKLSAYQAYILENMAHKYDFSRVVKFDDVLYVPYLSPNKKTTEFISHIIWGPKCDLIGPDNLVASNIRKSKIYSVLRQTF